MTRSNSINLFRRTPANLVASVAACARELSGIDGELAARYGESFRKIAVDVAAPIPVGMLEQTDILVIEIDPSVPASLARIERIRASLPNLQLIGAVRGIDLTTVRALVRRGISDVISLPFDAEELFSAVIYLGSAMAKPPGDLAPMCGVVHSTGGIGASTIISHLAAAVVEAKPGTRCCIVDLDLQFGEQAALFGNDNQASVLDCLDAGERLDNDIIDKALVEVRRNVFLLPAPLDVPPPEDIDTDQLLRLLTMLRQRFDHVLLDLPFGWTSSALSAACSCSELIVVVDHTLRSLGRARKTIGLLDTVEFPRNDLKLVINRAEKRMFQAIDTDDVANALGREVIASLPLVKSGLTSLQERGLLLGEDNSRAPFVRAVEELADRIVSAQTGRAS